MRKLSGSGHVGFSCPKCDGDLECQSIEYQDVTIRETYICKDCLTRYQVFYEAKSWEEL